jgi:hypothetical protein
MGDYRACHCFSFALCSKYLRTISLVQVFFDPMVKFGQALDMDFLTPTSHPSKRPLIFYQYFSKSLPSGIRTKPPCSNTASSHLPSILSGIFGIPMWIMLASRWIGFEHYLHLPGARMFLYSWSRWNGSPLSSDLDEKNYLDVARRENPTKLNDTTVERSFCFYQDSDQLPGVNVIKIISFWKISFTT